MSDSKLINSVSIPNTELIDSFAMKPIKPNSLIIQNGVMFILGGVSSGKSTLISKLIKIYDEYLNPEILCFYSGFSPDETTQFILSNVKMNMKPYFIQLSNNEAFISFFNQFKAYRLKYSELLLFLNSIYHKSNIKLFELLRIANELFHDVDDIDENNSMKRFKFLMRLVNDSLNLKHISHLIYWSDYVHKTYAKKHKIDFNLDPVKFISNCLVSLSKALNPLEIVIIADNDTSKRLSERVKKFIFRPQIRFNESISKLELIPSVCVFDDIGQFPLLTTERASSFVKDLFAETRRWKNTFIIAAQRHSLLNKSLRALTHTFFIGYSLIDDDLPRIAREMPSNLMTRDEFLKLYNDSIKPFSFVVFNNKLGINVIQLKK